MMRFKFLMPILLVLLAMGIGTAAVAADSPDASATGSAVSGGQTAENGTPAPAAFAPEAIYEFDPVLDGEEIVHDFVIQNRGNAELNITKVRTG
jgi:hypothetical protein